MKRIKIREFSIGWYRMRREGSEWTPAGYSALIKRFNLKVIPHFRESFIGTTKESFLENHTETHVFPKKYLPKNPENVFSQLEFAFKYDGINPEILKALFVEIEESAITQFIRKFPTGKFSRKIWYLYEKLTGQELELPDANRGSYTLLLDPNQYYTGKPVRSRRHYIDDNLLGNFAFCPFVRKTGTLKVFEEKTLDRLAAKIIHRFDPELISRAMRYLYMRETMSSFEIERERPQKKRMNRFVEMLQEAERLEDLDKKTLVAVQNLIVDPRFAEVDYRSFQNYIGEEPSLGQIIVHFIPPKPADLSELMEGWFSCLQRMMKSQVDSIIIAAAASFGFVFIHPFGDGNGRLHRFLIHYILSKTGFVQSGSIFPVSSTILRDMQEYDRILEEVSKPLMRLIESYDLDPRGELEVKQETVSFYRYIDFTWIAEYLFGCIEQTIEDDFKKELEYLFQYDRAKKEIRNVVDMPDRNIDLIIRFIYQNNGILSKKKGESHFSMLTEEEIAQIEEIIRSTVLSQ